MRLTLKSAPPQRLELSALSLASDAAAISRLPVGTTKEQVFLGDVFRVSARDAGKLVVEGGLAGFDGIGTGWASGEIVVEGDAGARLGRNMSGGVIRVSGDAGVWCGSGMSGGRIVVQGGSGPWAGGPLAGEMSGMSGGVIRIMGDAGHEAGLRMRRGTILVGGNCGPYAGRSMIAGTIAIGGRAAKMPGYGMKRGTILVAGAVAEMSATFMDCGPVELAFLGLLSKVFAGEGFAMKPKGWRRYAGDTAVLGKGEIFLRAR